MTYNNSDQANCLYIEKIDWQRDVIPAVQRKLVEKDMICDYCPISLLLPLLLY